MARRVTPGPNGRLVTHIGTDFTEGDLMAKSDVRYHFNSWSYGTLFSMPKSKRSFAHRVAHLPLVSIGVAGCLALTGCVSGGQPDKTSSPTSPSHGPGSTPPQSRPAIQSRTFTDASSTLKFDILSLARLNSSQLKLEIRLTALNNEDVIASRFGTRDFSRISLIDGRNMKAYFPSTSQQGQQMQAGYPENDLLEPGTPLVASIFYPSPPANVSNVDINSPISPPFNDIPIQGTAQVQKGEPDPTKVPLKAPHIENLISTSDDLSGNKSIDEGNSGESIRLNSDVLFALNKATLSSKAKGILKDVASQIDNASTGIIKVDGYTDNSGNDAINNPLSQRRAKAVASELKKLVTRSGVTYQTAGHGSADPVASNDKKTGRQKNRRVTVTIGK